MSTLITAAYITAAVPVLLAFCISVATCVALFHSNASRRKDARLVLDSLLFRLKETDQQSRRRQPLKSSETTPSGQP